MHLLMLDIKALIDYKVLSSPEIHHRTDRGEYCRAEVFFPAM
jgi:hypothetical protein